MNGQRPNRQRPSGQRPVQRPSGQRPAQRPAPRRQDMNDALNERYEEMVAPSKRVDDINRGKYADLSTFESRGHRKIDPAIMRAKRQRELIRKAVPVVAVCLILIIVLWVYFGVIRPSSMYDEAVAFFEKGDYSSAEKIFDKLDDYKETGDYLAYIDGRNAFKSGDYANAKIIYESLGDFYDSRDVLAQISDRLERPSKSDEEKKTAYAEALILLGKGEYQAARDAFLALGDYSDSAEKAAQAGKELDYAEAMRLLSVGDYDGARRLLESLGDFRDSALQLDRLNGGDTPPATNPEKYAQAKAALEEKDYRTANLLFNELGDYLDSKAHADYTYAIMCMANGDYGTAMVCFDACKDILDSADRLYEAKYRYANQVYSLRDYSRLPEVIELFASLGGYLDSADMLEGARSQYREHAIYTYSSGDKEAALSMFEFLSGYGDCDSWAQTIRGELATH